MTQPWKKPEPATSGLARYVNCLALFVIGGYHSAIPMGDQVKDAIRASVILLDGEDAGQELINLALFNVRFIQRFRPDAGRVVLGRIVGLPARGNNLQLDLLDPTPYDEQLAGSWLAAYPTRLADLTTSTVASYQVEEANLQHSSTPARPAAPANPPPNNPPPTGPQFGQTQPAPAAQPWATQQAPPQPSAPPPWVGASGQPPAPPSTTDQPPY